MADLLAVDLVAPDRTVWTGEATMVIARTAEGEVGILPHHAPLLGALTSGPVIIRQEGGGAVVAAVHGGFLSVADNRVGILVELAELADEIDQGRAQQALERARTEAGDDDAKDALRRAEARVRAHELAG